MNRGTIYVALSQFCQGDQQPREMLREAGFEVRENDFGRRIRREEMYRILRDVDGVLAGVEPYDGDLLTALPRLRCISRCGVGTDAIDLEEARRRNIVVLTTVEEVVEPVAQMTVAMILALVRNLTLHCTDMRAGQWRKQEGHLLSEWTIGLVGFGRIGRAVERYLRVFGAKVIVTDPNIVASEIPPEVQMCDLASLLGQADVVLGRDKQAFGLGEILVGQTLTRALKLPVSGGRAAQDFLGGIAGP